ncbi:PAS domain S-box protein [Halogeometricum limi]|uniref:histidine kinase n=1 Tax=Halogeometricum limi TaxID=555875 RepID=A0A1I6ILG4_9EURY|nr:PAS domain S-box protein [Halogeometricum limi]SFR67524.1 PAS domain S-box-containing protein [Halogeometricum limi]
MTETVRVLHVDDDPAFGELVATHLERRGFDVVSEIDPEAAVQRLSDSTAGEQTDAEPIDCVVSDYEMGETTGIDLLRRVRDRDERLPFVLFTSRGSEEVASEAISEGVTDYIQKQTRAEQYELLANRIHNAVEHYRVERRLRESEQLYRTVVERSHDAIYIYQDDRFKFVNRRACELSGYSEDELVEKDIWSLLHPDDRERVRHIAQERKNESPDVPSRYGARIVTKDGTTRRCKFSVQLIQYEGRQAVLGSVREVSEEERVEERFQALIERSSDLVSIIARDGTIEYQSPSCERILGAPAELVEGVNVLQLIHPDDRHRMERTLNEMYDADPTTVEMEQFRILNADGSWVWLEAIARADPVESIDGIVVNSRDVTERRAREQQLRRYENLVRNSPHGACILNTDLRVEFANEHVAQRFGESPDSLAGRHLSILREFDTIDDDAYETVRSAVERILKDDSDNERFELEADLPEITHVEVSVSPLRDVRSEDGLRGHEYHDDPRGVVLIINDVSKRVRYQERLNALHSATRDLTTATTREDVAEIVSDAAANILDYPLNGVAFYDPERDALVAQARTDVADSVVEVSEIPRGTGVAWRVFETGEGEVFENVAADPNVANPDTKIRSELILPIGDEGVLMAGSCTPGEMNDSRVSLARILTSNASAALERVEREQLLRRHERELESQNEQLEQVANVVSHDLRNPLNLASGQLELLRANYPDDDDAVAEHIDRIADAHERIRRIIEDMLDLARHGQPVEELETVLLGSVVHSSWKTAAGETESTLDVEDELGVVAAHEGRLKQLFENLFRNAVEHNPDRPVTVRVGRLDDGGFFVEDDGLGIPEEKRDTVFDPGVTTNPEGTGLGLGIVRTVATAHGWEVSVTQSESGGARFEIRTDSSTPGEPSGERAN